VDGSSDADPIALVPGSGVVETPANSEVFNTVSMITQIADEVFVANYRALSASATSFAASDGSLTTYCNAIGTDQEAATFDAAQEQWQLTMAAVQATEMHVLGPAAANEDSLRSRVHSYGAGRLSTCGIDQSVVLAEESGFDVTSRSINQRGMGAIGYLLFNSDLTHTCASQVPETQSWDERPESERRIKRCDLAAKVAVDVADAAAIIDVDWQTYRASFVNQDNAGTSLQLITDGLFALDKLVKDLKLTVPTGFSQNCSARTCPDLVESPYSQSSYQNVRDNLLSFRKIFSGDGGLGFDDYLNNEGFPEVSTRFFENINAAIAVVDAADASISAEVASIQTAADETACTNAFAASDQPNQLNACRLAGSIKRITDDLKIDFVTIVGVMIPDSAQSDND
jgi:predicted lipoprotein